MCTTPFVNHTRKYTRKANTLCCVRVKFQAVIRSQQVSSTSVCFLVWLDKKTQNKKANISPNPPSSDCLEKALKGSEFSGQTWIIIILPHSQKVSLGSTSLVPLWSTLAEYPSPRYMWGMFSSPLLLLTEACCLAPLINQAPTSWCQAPNRKSGWDQIQSGPKLLTHSHTASCE